jgi:hypothetical protein
MLRHDRLGESLSAVVNQEACDAEKADAASRFAASSRWRTKRGGPPGMMWSTKRDSRAICHTVVATEMQTSRLISQLRGRPLGCLPTWVTGFLIGCICNSGIADALAAEPSASAPEVPVVPCSLALPGSMTEALGCPDKGQAMRALDASACFSPNSQEAIELRRVWLSRESLAVDAAARDPVVQTFMANCIVGPSRGVGALSPREASAVEYLRKALHGDNPQVAGIAIVGLSAVLDKEDVATIVWLGSTQSALAIPAIAGLSMACMPEAKAGVATIRGAYAGTQQEAEIGRFIDGSQGLMEHCGPNGRASSKAFVGEVVLPQGRFPDAKQVKAALESEKDPKAIQTLLDVSCTADHADAVGEMRNAWRARDTTVGTLVSDPVAQAVIARCLIQVDSAASAAKTEIAEATATLRSAIHSDNVMSIVAAVEGLAIVGADEDVERIAGVPRRNLELLNWTVRVVGFTCGKNNLKTLALIRKEAITEKVRDQIEAVYRRIKPAREQTCGKGK